LEEAKLSTPVAGCQTAPVTTNTKITALLLLLLLLHAVTGKAYAGWRGHDQDALAAYDTLIGAFPTDFRGYLAKGVFLKERGRQGDAERMFLQVRATVMPPCMQG
jgi:hypothetical protein